MKKSNDDAVLEKEFDFDNAVRNPYMKNDKNMAEANVFVDGAKVKED